LQEIDGGRENVRPRLGFGRAFSRPSGVVLPHGWCRLDHIHVQFNVTEAKLHNIAPIRISIPGRWNKVKVHYPSSSIGRTALSLLEVAGYHLTPA
jgi:hypothetical protein